MAEHTAISWCDATINFWHGCQKVSEGCKFCYMYRDKEKYGQDGNNIQKTNVKTIDRILKDLKNQNLERIVAGKPGPLKIFTCSWSDFFIEQADEWREEAWQYIRFNSQFVWIILTKRPERIKQCLPDDWGDGWDHVWLLVSAENQERFDERVPILAGIPAKVRGVSIEPILGPIRINKDYPVGKGEVPFGLLMQWLIIGGESGNDTGKWRYRKAELNWFFDIIKQSKEMGIPVFVKQLGTGLAKDFKLKNRAGDHLEEWPGEDLKIQQFPNDRKRV